MKSSRTILITGTRKGIGKYLVHYYAEKGYKVIGCSRENAEYNLDNYEHFLADVSNEEDVIKIFNAIKKKVDLIKINTHYGDPIAKKLIPKEYKDKYGVTNLFRVELPNFWRMLYTLTNDNNEIEIIGFVLDIIDHKKYNKKFGYKNR